MGRQPAEGMILFINPHHHLIYLPKLPQAVFIPAGCIQMAQLYAGELMQNINPHHPPEPSHIWTQDNLIHAQYKTTVFPPAGGTNSSYIPIPSLHRMAGCSKQMKAAIL